MIFFLHFLSINSFSWFGFISCCFTIHFVLDNNTNFFLNVILIYCMPLMQAICIIVAVKKEHAVPKNSQTHFVTLSQRTYFFGLLSLLVIYCWLSCFFPLPHTLSHFSFVRTNQNICFSFIVMLLRVVCCNMHSERNITHKTSSFSHRCWNS